MPASILSSPSESEGSKNVDKNTDCLQIISRIRCGAINNFSDSESDDDDDEEEDDRISDDNLDDESEEEEEEEIEAISKLKESLEKKNIKSSKRVVMEALEKSKPIKITKSRKKRRTSILKLLRVPYIIRASLNPFTFLKMSKLYFASLFNINFLEEDATKGLRSALDEKAKKDSSGGGGRKRKRVMKPGQAKTLSDLPQLSA